MELDQVLRSLHICAAVRVEPSDTKNLTRPGTIFLDATSGEGTAIVELIDGGVLTIAMVKGVLYPYIVKKVFTGGTATVIFVNPISIGG